VRIDDLSLKRPITVDPQRGVDIVIWARMNEPASENGIQTIKAGIYKADAGTSIDYFKATFRLGLPAATKQQVVNLPPKALDIRPQRDLYRDTLLFQGIRFQKIISVWSLREDAPYAGQAVFSTAYEPSQKSATVAFDHPEMTLLLGDPFYRDTLLQSAAMLIPQDTALPVHIDRWEIFPYPDPLNPPAEIAAAAAVVGRTQERVETVVKAVSPEGMVLDQLKGYQLKVLHHHDDYPTVADLIEPDRRDAQILEKSIRHCCQEFGVTAPQWLMVYQPGLHDLTTDQRHARETPFLCALAAAAVGESEVPAHLVGVKWEDTGQPVVTVANHAPVRAVLAHDDRYLFGLAGAQTLGCDIVPLSSRSRSGWDGILGQAWSGMIDVFMDKGDTLDRAGCRTWAIMETLKKAGLYTQNRPRIGQVKDSNLLIHLPEHPDIFVLTMIALLTRGRERLLALTVAPAPQTEPHSAHTDEAQSAYASLLAQAHYEIVPSGPQGQLMFVHRLPLGFRPNANLSRTVYFPHFFFWAGEVREASVWPVLNRIADQFATGKFGGVTNFSHLQVLGEATASEHIEIRLWSPGNGGPQNSTMDLTFDFRKMQPDGGSVPIAWLEQQVTWVEILDHGKVKIAPYPDYYEAFIQDMLPRYDAPQPIPSNSESFAQLEQASKAPIIYEVLRGPGNYPLLYEHTLHTALGAANLVGNIYFANYYAWMGLVRDLYFQQMIPEYYQGIGDKGELLCTECRVDHLREAMPFDRIRVALGLQQFSECAATFYLEYYRKAPGREDTKLAFGVHRAVWVRRNNHGNPVPAEFPQPVLRAFEKAVALHKQRP
jgi:acyl-CoA thioesterase FadM